MINLSDITFVRVSVEGNPPDLTVLYKRISRPNKPTLSLVTALLNSDNFQQFAKDMREEGSYFGKPDSWLVSEIIYTLDTFFAKDREFIIGLLMEYDLWDGLAESILMLIVYDVFPEINPKLFPDIGYFGDNLELSEQLKEHEEKLQKLTGITFSHIVSKTEFMAWVNKNWKYIEKRNSEYLLQSPVLKDKIANLALIDQIYQLHEKGKTALQISKSLSSKYPKHPYVSDYAWVTNKIVRYKERIAKFKKRFKTPKNHFPLE